MNTLIITSFAVLLVSSNALLFDVTGGMNNVDAYLVKTCRPVDPPAHGSVSCAYSATDLTCTASCDRGYHFEGVPQNGNIAIKCTTTAIWPTGVNFPMCIQGSGQAGTDMTTTQKPPVFTGTSCVAQLSACPNEGNFHACTACKQFVTCAPDGIFLQTCPEGSFWDDSIKRCELTSSTCS